MDWSKKTMSEGEISTPARVKRHSIFVGNLPLDATPAQLEAVFKKFGAIKDNNIQVRSSKGSCYGFVEFETESSVQAAIEETSILIGSRTAHIEEQKNGMFSGSRRFDSDWSMLIGLEDVEEDEDMEMDYEGAAYPCPYCAEDFDDAKLVEFHIQDAHPSQLDYVSETCPVCAARIGTDMVEHLIAKHRNSVDMEQLLKLMKAESYSDSSSYGEQFHGSSRTTSSEAEEAFSKLLSFICEVPPPNEVETVQSNLSESGDFSSEKFPEEEQVERAIHPPPTLEEKAADKEARSRCDFAQTLTFSALFDIDL